MRIDPNAVYSSYKKQLSKAEEQQPSVRGAKVDVKEGQVVKGQILDMHQSGAKIRLSNGQVIEAKVAGDFQFSIGDNVQFVVKDASSGLVVLSPDTNASEQMASKLMNILSSAGIPDTAENQELIKVLVKNNMPIDGENIKSMIQMSKQHPEASMKQLVFMVKHDIPITSENIQQLQMMENNEHALMKSIASLAQDITQAQTDGQGVNSEQMHNILSGDEKAMSFLQGTSVAIKDLSALVGPQSSESIVPGEQVAGDGQVPSSGQVLQEASPHMKEMDVNIIKTAIALDKAFGETVNIPIKDMVMEGDLAKLSAFMTKGAGLAIDETTTMKDMLLMMKEGFIKPDQLRDFTLMLKEQGTYLAVAKGLLASKTELQNVEQLKAYFEGLHEKVSLLTNEQNNMTGEGGPLKEAANVKASVEFMSALNQDYNLLHLPMLLGDTLLNSEMYVLNDKKAKLKDNDSLTALVRLDLLNLGHTDIYMKKTGKNVDVKFYMTDEQQVPVVNEHLVTLHKMLTKKGFNVMGLHALPVEEAFDVKKDFFEKDGSQGEFKRYTFDMRA